MIKVVVPVVLACVAFAVLMAWVTWSFVLDSISRTMILDLLGFASVGGQ